MTRPTDSDLDRLKEQCAYTHCRQFNAKEESRCSIHGLYWPKRNFVDYEMLCDCGGDVCDNRCVRCFACVGCNQ